MVNWQLVFFTLFVGWSACLCHVCYNIQTFSFDGRLRLITFDLHHHHLIIIIIEWWWWYSCCEFLFFSFWNFYFDNSNNNWKWLNSKNVKRSKNVWACCVCMFQEPSTNRKGKSSLVVTNYYYRIQMEIEKNLFNLPPDLSRCPLMMMIVTRFIFGRPFIHPSTFIIWSDFFFNQKELKKTGEEASKIHSFVNHIDTCCCLLRARGRD